ncbi:serine/threonine-protein kinase WNK8-like [Chenopodium quinoa]|uniref:serine/threonine-protein kinase WNK8-like n=1 Tax=Chenopodium quinoa TaxID=63459 RepID=UPI000B78677D|nr:serine/threonine-protein kinase WNK8-like [Chenopodium quinoa]
MTLVQTVTKEKLYSECYNKNQIYRMIKKGEMPAALNNVVDYEFYLYLSSSVMASSSQEGNIDFETSSSGRYIRYNEIIGKGTTKKVYKGLDRALGMEIAWCKTELTEDMLNNMEFLELLLTEGGLLMLLDHENIVKCYDSWVDEEAKTIHMITEYFPSGNLVQYLRNNHTLEGNAAIKNWCRQILNGIAYLHSQTPPIVHRDIKAENIFINGKTGCVKLADFGFALSLEQGTCSQKYGTPRYMAPEIREGNGYNQLADIHSFGMCVLEMFTGEPPYSNCSTQSGFLALVEAGVEPPELCKVEGDDAYQFISKCLAPASERPSAIELLNDPFLAPSFRSILTARFLSLVRFVHRVCSCLS